MRSWPKYNRRIDADSRRMLRQIGDSPNDPPLSGHGHAATRTPTSRTRSSTRSATRRSCACSRIGAGLRRSSSPRSSTLNPGGSIKDRVAVALIEAAERDGRAAARRHDRRADVGQHGHRPGDRRAAQGLPRDRGDAGQDVARRRSTCCAPTAPRSSSRRPTSPPDSPQSYYRVADRLTEEIPGAFQPNQYFNPANPQRTTRRPAPSCGSRPAGRSPTWSPASAPAGPSPAPGATCKERNPDIAGDRRRPRRLDLLRRRGRFSPYLVEGVGEDFWPETFDPSSSTATSRSPTRTPS